MGVSAPKPHMIAHQNNYGNQWTPQQDQQSEHQYKTAALQMVQTNMNMQQVENCATEEGDLKNHEQSQTDRIDEMGQKERQTMNVKADNDDIKTTSLNAVSIRKFKNIKSEVATDRLGQNTRKRGEMTNH